MSSARIHGIRVGLPRDVEWEGRQVSTGIFKELVSGAVRVNRLALEGDGQADLRVHGGEHKAVYSYALEHYPEWRAELGREIEEGAFGENLTTEGLEESEIRVGDRFQFGSEVILEAAQPRFPCFKLGIRLADPSIVKTFLERERWGVYWRVEKEGAVAAGDPIRLLSRHPAGVRISDVFRLTKGALVEQDRPRVRALLDSLPTLCPKLRAKLEKYKGPG